MTRKDILIRYRQIVLEINSLEEQAKFLNRYIGGPKPVRAVQITGMPRGTNDPEAAMIQQVEDDDPTLEIRMKGEELRNYLPEFNRIIAAIEDDRTRNVIRDYYGLGWTDKRIGRQQCLSDKRVNQIRLDFLKTLE